MIWPEAAQPESRFTQPTETCPNPEMWSSTDSESTEREVAALIHGLVRALQPDICIETGTAFGEVAHAIGTALHANGHGQLLTIESDHGRVVYAAARLRGLPVSVIEADTMATRLDCREDVGFAWFDSYYRLRVPEFHHYRPLMRRGAIVGFHDTAPGHGAHRMGDRSIRRTIEHELGGLIRMIHLPTPRGVTLAEVL